MDNPRFCAVGLLRGDAVEADGAGLAASVTTVEYHGAFVSVTATTDAGEEVLALVPQARAEGVDAIVIACFDDTGLARARATADRRVIGIGQSAYVAATLLGHRFSVVTTLEVSVPVIEGNIAAHGFSRACASVGASGLPVLVVEGGSEATRLHLAGEIRAAFAGGATAAVLGCAGMASLRADLSARAGVPLIDGVAASIQLAPALARRSFGAASPGMGGHPDVGGPVRGPG